MRVFERRETYFAGDCIANGDLIEAFSHRPPKAERRVGYLNHG